MQILMNGSVVGRKLNLGERPMIESTKLVQIPDGAQDLGQNYKDNWYSVSYDGLSGYVMKKYVQIISDVQRDDEWL